MNSPRSTVLEGEGEGGTRKCRGGGSGGRENQAKGNSHGTKRESSHGPTSNKLFPSSAVGESEIRH